MIKVILNCDNTLSVHRSDVDDGLTLMYLYAHEEIDLLGVTTTFGNNAHHVVYANTLQMLEDLNIHDLKVFGGARTVDDLESEAADFLVDRVNRDPGEIVVISTGPVHNLYCAHAKDPTFYEKAKRLIIMGGTKALVPAGRIPHTKLWIKLAGRLIGARLDELNFSSAPHAAYHVLEHGKRISLLSTQLTFQAWFGESEIEALRREHSALAAYLVPILERFIDDVYAQYLKDRGFFNWDLATALYLTNPELFETRPYRVALSEANLKSGLIPEDRDGSAHLSRVIDLPTRILSPRQFNRLFLEKLSVIAERMET
jgi:inosine-uridine nucleoside N-ribohydrolase